MRKSSRWPALPMAVTPCSRAKTSACAVGNCRNKFSREGRLCDLSAPAGALGSQSLSSRLNEVGSLSPIRLRVAPQLRRIRLREHEHGRLAGPRCVQALRAALDVAQVQRLLRAHAGCRFDDVLGFAQAVYVQRSILVADVALGLQLRQPPDPFPHPFL